MKFFVTSDLHSFLEPFVKALEASGFDKSNPEHYLVVCGDVFDRGDDSIELLKFLMSIERKILIRGNHDSLLEECCMREFPYSHDRSNGTVKTICAIGKASSGYSFDECCRRTIDITAEYRASLVNYLETESYIFVHSWLPLKCSDSLPNHYIIDRQFEYDSGWRNASQSAWERAMWGNPYELAAQGFNKTGKTIVFGHFHTSWPRAVFEGKPEFGEDADFSPYCGDGYIALDACTVASGKTNVIVLEDNFLNKEGI